MSEFAYSVIGNNDLTLGMLVGQAHALADQGVVMSSPVQVWHQPGKWLIGAEVGEWSDEDHRSNRGRMEMEGWRRRA